MRSSNRRVKSSSRCAMNPCKDSASWRKGGGAARQWSDGEWHGDLRSALWLHSSWTRSRPLRSAHSCTARLPLSPSLNICCVCAVCDRRGGCSCCSGARIDERTRPCAAARCSIPAWTTRSAWDHRALSRIDALPRFRGAPGGIGVPRWLPRAPVASQASEARVICVGRGPGAWGR